MTKSKLKLECSGWMISENHHPPASINGTDKEGSATPESLAMHDVLRVEKEGNIVAGGVHQQRIEKRKKMAFAVFADFSHVRITTRGILSKLHESSYQQEFSAPPKNS